MGVSPMHLLLSEGGRERERTERGREGERRGREKEMI
jgi:hypothetical protein